MKKCVLLFSGGLDSRLALKIMQEQVFDIIAVYFKLPFSCSSFKDVEDFLKKQKVKLKIFDCNKGRLLKEYLRILKKGEHGRGSGINPCKDCKLFMFKEAKKFADSKKIGLIVSGEVLGERPMSQTKKSLDLIEEKAGLKGRLLRPLSAKLLPETNAEKKELVDRDKFYDIEGRQRKEQIKLARKFKIDYPHPAGGCLLCEKLLKKRFQFLLKRGIKEEELPLIGIGRHFIIDDFWIILGRDEKENRILGKFKFGKLIVPEFPGPSAKVLSKSATPPTATPQRAEARKIIKKVNKIIKAYSKKGSLKERKEFEKYKI